MKKDLERLKKINKLIDSESSSSNEKLSPRQRMALLFDNGNYKEIFRYARNSELSTSFKDGIICASGFVNGRPVLAYATEPDAFGGSLGRVQTNQLMDMYKLSRQSGIPIISLIESAGARITDAMHIMEGYAGVMKEAIFCSGVVPQVSCVLGYCIGAAAFTATLTDFISMYEKGSMGISGAAINKVATGEDLTDLELGGADVHTKFSGGVHFVEKSEEEAIEKVRKLMEFLPQNNSSPPPFVETDDPEDREEPSVEKIIPEDTETPFDIKKLIRLFVDEHNFFEVQPEFAPNLVTGFARFGGVTVGICANQSLHMAGAFDSNAFRKMARFVNFVSTFNYPLITFVDVPGAIPTLEENKNGILIHGSQLLHAMGNLKTLKIGIVVRRCFGGAYVMMNPKISGGDIVYAYPGAMIGIMSDKAVGTFLSKNSPMYEKLQKLHEQGGRSDEPYMAATYGYIDDIIQPSKTRGEIIHALKVFGNKRFLDIPPKWLNNIPL